MLYIKIVSNNNKLEIVESLTESQFRVAHKNTSLPKIITVAIASALGYSILKDSYTDLRPTFDKILKFDIVESDNGEYDRIWYLEELDTFTSEQRKINKWKEVKKIRDEKLLSSDRTQLADNYILSAEWRNYRTQLKNMELLHEDPYLVIFPEAPSIKIQFNNINEYKEYLKLKVKEYISIKIDSRPRVDTGLGYFVDGGNSDLTNLAVAKDLGLDYLKDADNNFIENISAEDWDIIINKIKLNGLSYIRLKWQLQTDIDAATNMDELKVIANSMI